MERCRRRDRWASRGTSSPASTTTILASRSSESFSASSAAVMPEPMMQTSDSTTVVTPLSPAPYRCRPLGLLPQRPARQRINLRLVAPIRRLGRLGPIRQEAYRHVAGLHRVGQSLHALAGDQTAEHLGSPLLAQLGERRAEALVGFQVQGLELRCPTGPRMGRRVVQVASAVAVRGLRGGLIAGEPGLEAADRPLDALLPHLL